MTPSPDEDKRQQVHEIVAEFARRSHSGNHESTDDLLAQHPELHNELSAELKKLQVVQAALATARSDVAVDASTIPGKDETLTHFSTASYPRLPPRIVCPNCCQPMATSDVNEAESPVNCESCGVSIAFVEAGPESRAGEMVAHFRLLDLLGRGGFGAVWRAADTQLDRIVAIKLPRTTHISESEAELFMREARTVAQLQHPHIVRVHEVGRDGDTMFIVSDLVQGAPLSQRVAERQVAIREAATIVAKVAKAMQYAHDKGIVHRDLKPQNILIDDGGQPFVTDFGLARRAAVEVTMTGDGAILGTPVYMSPEQAAGDAHHADARSDVYSLGVTLYHLLTGEVPFRGSTASVIRQVATDEPPRPRKLNPQIDRDLETICLHAMEKTTTCRYQTAGELADDLERWLKREPIAARRVGPMGRFSRWCVRKPAIAALLGLVAAVALAGFCGVTWQWRKAEAALVDARAAERRADANKESAWAVVNEFLVEATNMEFRDAPRAGAARKKLLQRATDYLNDLAASNDNDPQSRLHAAAAFHQLGHAQGSQGEIAEAMASLDRGLEICHSLRESDVDKTLLAHTKALVHRTRMQVAVFRSRGEIEIDAEAELTEARKLLEDILQTDPTNQEWLGDHADVLAKLGAFHLMQQDPRALEVLEEANDAWEQLLETAPDDPLALECQARCLLDIAQAKNKTGNAAEAVEYAKLGLDNVERALALAPDSAAVRNQLPTACSILSISEYQAGDLDSAIEHVKQGIAARQALIEDFPEHVYNREHMATLLSRLCPLYLEKQQYAEAVDSIQAAIAVYDQLIEETPDAPGFRQIRMMFINILGDAYLRMGEHQRAAQAFQRVLQAELPDADLAAERSMAYARYGRARGLIGIDRAQEALEEVRRGLAQLAAQLSAEPPYLETRLIEARLRTALVMALTATNQAKEAARSAQEYLPTMLELGQVGSMSALNIAVDYLLVACEALYEDGKYARAMSLFDAELGELSQASDAEPDPQRAILKSLAEAYERRKRPEVAKKWKTRLAALTET